jgi:outer membrane biosynthesis protein TonB
MVRAVCIVLVIIVGMGRARADRPIRLGTTGKGVDRAAVETALDGAFRAMTPCFRKASGTIKVKVQVGTDGEVIAATATAKGAPGQCVAGLLAVTRFPAGAWKAEVEIDAIRPEDWLNAQLGAHRGALSACQDRDAASKGEVALKLAIAKTGAVTSVTVDKATASKAIADCAKTAAQNIVIDRLPGGTDLTYRLVVSYNGTTIGGSSGGSSGGTTTTELAGGSSKGALAGAVIQDTWVAQRAKVMACGAKAKPGAVVASFAIRANGTVKNVVFKSSTIAKSIEDCVDAALRELKFPTASGETQVNLPISWSRK